VATITLTAKRQATLPREVCDEMHLEPGDRLVIEPRVIDGQSVWILRPGKVDWSWIGSLQGVRKAASHDMDDVRESIARGLGRRSRRKSG
jgi:bifunctional DNA-binding transcriptional regulator/antitoxin component of YhaV-PrlF toxin-antitoxin module